MRPEINRKPYTALLFTALTDTAICDNPPVIPRYGDRIKALREAEGRRWTIEELAAKAEVNKETVVRAERSENLQIVKIAAIADTLDVEVAELFGEPVLKQDQRVVSSTEPGTSPVTPQTETPQAEGEQAPGEDAMDHIRRRLDEIAAVVAGLPAMSNRLGMIETAFRGFDARLSRLEAGDPGAPEGKQRRSRKSRSG